MTNRRFAAWVEPIATETLAGADELLAFARSQPADFWDQPSAIEGWTRKDVLAHLAGDTGKMSLRLLRAAVHGAPFDDPPDFKDGGDAINAQDVEQRRNSSINELIAEIKADREEWRSLFLQLKDSDQDARWPGFPVTLGQYLRICAPHDREHLAEMGMEAEVRA